jgi:hypothetical protein
MMGSFLAGPSFCNPRHSFNGTTLCLAIHMSVLPANGDAFMTDQVTGNGITHTGTL